MTSEQRSVLELASRFPLISERQVTRLLDQDQDVPGVLGELWRRGLLREGPRLGGQARVWRITPAGARLAGGQWGLPVIELRRDWQDFAAGWLWVLARRGRFGDGDVFSRREMIAADRALQRRASSLMGLSDLVRARVAEGGFQVWPAGGSEPHYPELTFVLPAGRVAMELVHHPIDLAGLAELLEGYKRKDSVVQVQILTRDQKVASAVAAVAEQAGLGDRVRTNHFVFDRYAAF